MPDVLLVERSCFTCGAIFQALGLSHVCPSCRSSRRNNEPSVLGQPLSRREKQIVDLVMQAKENKEIAYALRLTEGTIKAYLAHIFDKTGACNRVDLAVRAVRGEIAL